MNPLQLLVRGISSTPIDTAKLGKQHNYTSCYWGHNIEYDDTRTVLVTVDGEDIQTNLQKCDVFNNFGGIRKNDTILTKMKSGKIGVWCVMKVERNDKIHDLYEVEMVHIGYTK